MRTKNTLNICKKLYHLTWYLLIPIPAPLPPPTTPPPSLPPLRKNEMICSDQLTVLCPSNSRSTITVTGLTLKLSGSFSSLLDSKAILSRAIKIRLFIPAHVKTRVDNSICLIPA